MDISCTRDRLAHALSKVEKIAGKGSSLPILSCILFEAKGRALTLRSTNLDLGMEIEILADVASEGRIAVPGTLISSFVSQIPKDVQLHLFIKDQNLVVEAGKNKTVIKAVDHEDFPTIPRITEGHSFTLEANDLVLGFKSVWYSASISSMKPELSSVYLYSADGYAVFVATDSFRLAEKRIKTPGVDISDTILIPFKNVPEIVRVLEQCDGSVTVTCEKNQISFESRGIYIVSRLIDGQFPDYKQIIPKESVSEVTVLKQELLNTLKLSTLFSDSFNQINVSIDPATDTFLITSRNNDKGENQNTVPATIVGEPLTINFNYRYIMDCIGSIQSDSVAMRFAGQHKPLVIRGVSDSSFTYLVMSMNR